MATLIPLAPYPRLVIGRHFLLLLRTVSCLEIMCPKLAPLISLWLLKIHFGIHIIVCIPSLNLCPIDLHDFAAGKPLLKGPITSYENHESGRQTGDFCQTLQWADNRDLYCGRLAREEMGQKKGVWLNQRTRSWHILSTASPFVCFSFRRKTEWFLTFYYHCCCLLLPTKIFLAGTRNNDIESFKRKIKQWIKTYKKRPSFLCAP